jgi:hypothetical protein
MKDHKKLKEVKKLKEKTIDELMEDYALSAPPERYRNSLTAHFAMFGIPMCMYYLAIGSLGVAFAGLRLGLSATIIAYIVFIIFAMIFGYLSWKYGYSWDVLCRIFGWGSIGSFLPSLIATFLFMSFWALETHWMATAFKQMYDINIWYYYLALFPLFTIIPFLGHKAIGAWNYIAIPIGLIATFYVLYHWYGIEGFAISATFQQASKPLIPGGFGAAIDWALVAVGLWGVTAGNFGRFCRSKKAALAIGPVQGFFSHIFFPILGILIVFPLVAKLTPIVGPEQAAQMAFLPSIPFVVAMGWLGAFIVLTYQLNIQYINAYLPSVNLSNFFQVIFKWHGKRALWVIVVNVLGLILLAAGLLGALGLWAGVTGAMLGSVVAVSIADLTYRKISKIPIGEVIEMETLNKVKEVNPLSFAAFIIGVGVGLAMWKGGLSPSASIVALPLTFVVYIVLSAITKGKYQTL